MTRPNEEDPRKARLASGGAPLPNPEEVNEFHRYDDVDNSPESHHHTLGIDPNQSSPGDHNHDGRNSKLVTVPAHSHGDTTQGKIVAKSLISPSWSVLFGNAGFGNITVPVVAGRRYKIECDIHASGSYSDSTAEVRLGNVIVTNQTGATGSFVGGSTVAGFALSIFNLPLGVKGFIYFEATSTGNMTVDFNLSGSGSNNNLAGPVNSRVFWATDVGAI